MILHKKGEPLYANELSIRDLLMGLCLQLEVEFEEWPTHCLILSWHEGAAGLFRCEMIEWESGERGTLVRPGQVVRVWLK